MVILDHDPDHVDTLRKFDMKVFYGDATRLICWNPPARRKPSAD